MNQERPGAFAVTVGVILMIVASMLIVVAVYGLGGLLEYSGRGVAKAAFGFALLPWIPFLTWCGVKLPKRLKKLEADAPKPGVDWRMEHGDTAVGEPSRPWNLPRKRMDVREPKGGRP